MWLEVKVSLKYISSVCPMQATFSRSRTDDARQGPIPAWLEEAQVNARASWARAHGHIPISERGKRPDPAVGHRPLSQTHRGQQKLPLELSNRDYSDERQPTARDQQDPEIWATAIESCDEEEEEDVFGQIERPRPEESQGVCLTYAKRPLKEPGHEKTWSNINDWADFMQMNSDLMWSHDLLATPKERLQWLGIPGLFWEPTCF